MIKFDKFEKKEIYTSVHYLINKFQDDYDGYDPYVITNLKDLLIKITDWIKED